MGVTISLRTGWQCWQMDSRHGPLHVFNVGRYIPGKSHLPCLLLTHISPPSVAHITLPLYEDVESQTHMGVLQV